MTLAPPFYAHLHRAPAYTTVQKVECNRGDRGAAPSVHALDIKYCYEQAPCKSASPSFRLFLHDLLRLAAAILVAVIVIVIGVLFALRLPVRDVCVCVCNRCRRRIVSAAPLLNT